LRKEWPAAQVIILTGYGDLPAAQRAIRLGVVEFLTKPCHLRDVELALERARQRREMIWTSQPDPDNAPQQAKAVTLANLEQQQILAALDRHQGNKTAAAAELGISRRTLHYRLAQYRSHAGPVE
jgi:DNA-binding NtrC family response regulator